MQLRKIFLLFSFFAATPVFIIFSIVYFSYISFQKDPANTTALFSLNNRQVSYAALPGTDITFQAYAQESDGRVAKLQQFFIKYNSPLLPFAQNIVDAADKYGLDYKILPAIAMQESGECKNIIPGSNNCWGWGIYAKHVTYFPDYPTAIDAVSRGLVQNYVKRGLTSPKEIMRIYNPTSAANGGTWAVGVNYFMSQLQ